ncbi:hypothetical protein [Paraburkholderia tropica]|uniref:hypothetical protein n=1 Tax=Paraburkholderia tropica TaxID=92647 RepID=UPI002AB71C7E|nr:hypothetical protein [Paraburkholderia tropica]
MTQNEFALLTVKGLRSEMDEAERGRFDAACNAIRAVIEKYGNTGLLAVGYIGLEVAVEEDKRGQS